MEVEDHVVHQDPGVDDDEYDHYNDEGDDEEFLKSFDVSHSISGAHNSKRKKRLSLTKIRAMNILKKQEKVWRCRQALKIETSGGYDFFILSIDVYLLHVEVVTRSNAIIPKDNPCLVVCEIKMGEKSKKVFERKNPVS